MRGSEPITLHVPEPLALIDATLLFTVQVLIARHPELLEPPEEPVLHPSPALRAARQLLDGIRELHGAIDAYREDLPTAQFDSRASALDRDDNMPL